ncbi:MAG: LytTR family DNA-binding domain-containing protein [Fluviicola sp.]|nr:LytTR family DNA-binding domain-containing protein [Fluviicola sp.]
MEAKTKYTCLIVDDEAIARQLIQRHLLQFPSIEVAQSVGSAIEANDYLKTHEVDLLFLDIHMPKLSGLDFLKSLSNPPKVIFTTAYSEFALEGFELNVIDYLLKPITIERFTKAVTKVLEIFKLENQIKEPSSVNSTNTSIVIKSSHQLIKVDLCDILYIEGLHKYVKIITNDKKYTSLIGLTAFEKELVTETFYRCHRSYIINLEKIKLIDGNQVMIGSFNIPISKNNRAELIAKMGKKIG